MGVTEHGSHLIKVTRLGAVNCYLVREPDGFTVIDFAIGGTARAIQDAARHAGAPIVRLTLTHAHLDHTGSLDALAAEVPEAEVSFGVREARFLRGDRSMDAGERGQAKNMAKVKTAPVRELSPGDRVGSLEIIAAPGHSPGQIAFLDTRDRTLIAGDAYSTLWGTYVTSKINPRFPLPALGTWDKELARRSAGELRALDPSRLAVGHGGVIEAPAAEMDRAIAAAG